MARPASPDAAPVRRRDAARTRNEILDVATSEFADRGFAGARVDEIAAKTRTTKRMIYYYFGGKEQLFIEVLERSYTVIRSIERDLDVEHLDPIDALRSLAELTFDHHESHPDFVRLVSIENIHRGQFIARLETLRTLGAPATSLLGQILGQGRELGVFREDVDALDVHILISSYCVFQVANRYTFGYLFDIDFTEKQTHAHLRRMIGDVVVGWLTSRQ